MDASVLRHDCFRQFVQKLLLLVTRVSSQGGGNSMQEHQKETSEEKRTKKTTFSNEERRQWRSQPTSSQHIMGMEHMAMVTITPSEPVSDHVSKL